MSQKALRPRQREGESAFIRDWAFSARRCNLCYRSGTSYEILALIIFREEKENVEIFELLGFCRGSDIPVMNGLHTRIASCTLPGRDKTTSFREIHPEFPKEE